MISGSHELKCARHRGLRCDCILTNNLRRIQMKPIEYEFQAVRTDLRDNYGAVFHRLSNLQTVRILHAAMGCCTESGELMDAVKKHLLYGKPLDSVNLQEEAGDLFWYVALLADAVGFTFEDTFEKNIAKLRVRYPDKFTEENALIRNLDEERRLLEGTKAQVEE